MTQTRHEGKNKDALNKAVQNDYAFGFVSNIESIKAPKGLSEKTIRYISKQKNEPEFMLEKRLQAFSHWKTLKEPHWARINYSPINYQEMIYYAAPKKQQKNNKEIAPEVQETFEKLGIPLKEHDDLGDIAVDAVLDSASITTTFQEELLKLGIIFCPISEAIQRHPALIKKYLWSVVPFTDNFFAALNASVFSDGSFCYIPKNVECPFDLSTYFRMNAANTGQFERTLIIAEEGSSVNYLEGCTAPIRKEHQLHAAVVEIIAHKNAKVNYSTVQNWYPGNTQGKGGILNFVTKRGICEGNNAHISWTQIETGSAKTWKYPSIILKGDHSSGKFSSVAITKNHQQADTGTKMIHIGNNTTSTILSKGIATGRSGNSYRGLVKITPRARNTRNYSRCDTLIIGANSNAHTFPTIDVTNSSAITEHEATTSTISDAQLAYCQQRGIDHNEAVNLVVNGFCKEVTRHLPLEFTAEAQKLLELSPESAST